MDKYLKVNCRMDSTVPTSAFFVDPDVKVTSHEQTSRISTHDMYLFPLLQELVLLQEEENISDAAELLSQVHILLDPSLLSCFWPATLPSQPLSYCWTHFNCYVSSLQLFFLPHPSGYSIFYRYCCCFSLTLQLKELLKFINPEYLSGSVLP